MLRSQLIQNDQPKHQTWLHRQNKQLPLATGCQEQQNGCGPPACRLCATACESHDYCWCSSPPPPSSCCSTTGSSSLGMQHWAALTLPSFSCLPLASPSQRSKNLLPVAYSGGKKKCYEFTLSLKRKNKGPPHEIQKKAQPWYIHTSVDFKKIIQIIYQQKILPIFKEDFYMDKKKK